MFSFITAVMNAIRLFNLPIPVLSDLPEIISLMKKIISDESFLTSFCCFEILIIPYS